MVRNLIDATFCPGIATNNSPNTQDRTFDDSVFLNRIVGILRTTRLELTVTYGEKHFQWTVVERKRVLIDPDEREKWRSNYFLECFHL